MLKAENRAEGLRDPAKARHQTPHRARVRPYDRRGAATYSRARDLPKLFALPPDEIEDDGACATERIIARLVARVRAQALLGRRRHWSYDLNRHLALLAALKAERAHLAHLRNAAELARLLAAAVPPAKPEAA
jgi:hypothetical protein